MALSKKPQLIPSHSPHGLILFVFAEGSGSTQSQGSWLAALRFILALVKKVRKILLAIIAMEIMAAVVGGASFLLGPNAAKTVG